MKKSPIKLFRYVRPPVLLWLVMNISFLAFVFQPVNGQDTGSGLDFLNISPSTTLLGISEAQTATPSGAVSIYSNPALLVFEESSVLDFSYTLWIADVQNQFAAAGFKRNRSAVGFGIYNSTSDDFEARDQPGEPAGIFSISYLSISGAYAYRIGPLGLGITGQYLREEVFQYRANGYAINAGAVLTLLNDRLKTGVVLMNVGEMQDLNNEATLLPITLRAGVDVKFFEFTTPHLNDLPILLSLHFDYLQPLEDNPSSDFISSDRREPFYNFGLTANIAEIFHLRTGLKIGPTERPFSIGAGFAMDPVMINYALVPFSTGYGTVHSIGLQYYF